MSDFSARIKKLRKERGLTQEELGKVIGVSKYAVLLYEKGKKIGRASCRERV